MLETLLFLLLLCNKSASCFLQSSQFRGVTNSPTPTIFIMRPFEIPYSAKDIPIPSKQQYLRLLVGSTESITNRVRWKLFHSKNPNHTTRKETFGFATPNPAPYDDDLKLFEKLMFEIPTKIKFRPGNHTSMFQRELARKVEELSLIHI